MRSFCATLYNNSYNGHVVPFLLCNTFYIDLEQRSVVIRVFIVYFDRKKMPAEVGTVTIWQGS